MFNTIDTTPITEKRQPKDLIQQFYRLNSKHFFSDENEMSNDIPVLYYDESGDLMTNDDYCQAFKREFHNYTETSLYTEALLVINRSLSYQPKALANDISEVLFVRLEYAHRTALELVEIEPKCYDALIKKAFLYSHFAVMCMITGCFSLAHDFIPKSLKYLAEANARREWETYENNRIK